jgi:hypothetical protein
MRTLGAPEGLSLVPGYSALYLFNEGTGTTLADYSGNGYHATLGSGAAAPAWGVTGLTYGGDDTTIVGTAAGLNLANQDHTLIVVCSPAGTGAENLIGKSSGGTNRWELATSGGKYRIAFRGSDAAVIVAAPNAYTVGAPAMVTAIRSGTALSLYVGAASQATGAVSTEPNVAALAFAIGSNPAGTSAFYNGAMHAAIVYPIALTEAQIAQNYAYLKALLAPRGVTIS